MKNINKKLNKKTISALTSFDIYRDHEYIIEVPAMNENLKLLNMLPFGTVEEDLYPIKNNINPVVSEAVQTECELEVIEENIECEEILQVICTMESDRTINVNDNMNPMNASALRAMIVNAYPSGNEYTADHTDYCMRINVMNNNPIFSGPRRLSYRERGEVKTKIDELLKVGIIRPSESPYASPIVLVKRKDGKM